MKERIYRGVFIGASLMAVVLAFTILDHAVHGLQDQWSVPDYYFRNKIPFGFLWSVVGWFLARKYGSVWTRALVVAGVVSITLQMRYFVEGYPLDFVLLFLLVHFLILFALSAAMFRVMSSAEQHNQSSMNKALVALLVLAVIAFGVYLLVFRGPGPLPVTPSPSPRSALTSTPGVPVATPTQISTPATGAVSVDIRNFAFTPSALTVKAGTRVTWTNNDNVSHAVVSDAGTLLGSPTLAPGQSYSVTFPTPGTFTYHCKIHPTMTGRIVVTP